MEQLEHEVIAVGQWFIGNEQVLREVPEAAMTWMLLYSPQGELCMSKGKGGNPPPKQKWKHANVFLPLVLDTFTSQTNSDQRICTNADEIEPRVLPLLGDWAVDLNLGANDNLFWHESTFWKREGWDI